MSWLTKYQVDPAAIKALSGDVHKDDRVEGDLGADYVPSNYDVITGRGPACYNHIGNRRFRLTVAMYLEKYQRAPTKMAKSLIMEEIVDKVHEAKGNFIRRCSKTQSWTALDNVCARSKVGHAVRDALLLVQKQRRESEPIMRSSRLYSDTFGIADPDAVQSKRASLSLEAKKASKPPPSSTSANPASDEFQALYNLLARSDLPTTQGKSKRRSFSACTA